MLLQPFAVIGAKTYLCEVDKLFNGNLKFPMKSIKHIVIGAFLALGAFCAVLYSSCSKDACKAVTCLNKGTCNGGTCNCPTGIGGLNCEKIYRKQYAFTYRGIATYGIIHTDTNNTLTFNPVGDTTYTKMQLVWSDPGFPVISLPITLTNSSSTGSDFNVVSTTVDTFTYTGSGSVNGTIASLSLTKTHANGPSIIVTFTDFNRQ